MHVIVSCLLFGSGYSSDPWSIGSGFFSLESSEGLWVEFAAALTYKKERERERDHIQ